MITKVRIRNYKTLEDTELTLGRINVIIGVNGAGKSNLAEAIALGVAGAQGKLDSEYLTARGIRLTHPKFMRSGFGPINSDPIRIDLTNDQNTLKPVINVELNNDGKPYSKWVNPILDSDRKFLEKMLVSIFKPGEPDLSEHPENIHEGLLDLKRTVVEKNKDMFDDPEFADFMRSSLPEFVKNLVERGSEIEDFVIYKPEETFLRKFDSQGQLEPLGMRGEGLLKLLTVFSSEKPEILGELRKHLKLFDWFEDIKLKDQLIEKEVYFDIQDKYLNPELGYFDQRSSNEGFLYLAFYISLFLSETAPKNFAIDNVDNALNPKLCTRLVKLLTTLAKEYGKQAIITTHNPAVLDGLDLNDPEQKLFVVSRKRNGATRISEVKVKPTSDKLMKLSEMFMSGMLGGLPKNFA